MQNDKLQSDGMWGGIMEVRDYAQKEFKVSHT